MNEPVFIPGAIERLLEAFARLDPELVDKQLCESLADALWLARLRIFEPGERIEKISDERGRIQPPGLREEGVKDRDKGTGKPPGPRPGHAPITPQPRDIYAAGGAGGSGKTASPVRIPGGLALPNALAIGRALRPLRRYRDSRFEFTLDEELTVERSAANNGEITPAFVPIREKLLEVALVVEETATMTVWHRTADEFQRLLERQGAFRDVRRWRLRLDPRPALLNRNGVPSSPDQLRDNAGHQVILILTQGTHRAWRQKDLCDWLWKWGANQPVAIVQLLPDELWKHTALGPRLTDCKSPARAAANIRLEAPLPSWYDPDDPKPLAVPILPLDPKAVERWARMAMAVRGTTAPALLIDREPEPAPENKGEQEELSAQERINGFLRSASGEAWQLVRNLAPIQFNVPVMRLVQRATIGGRALQTQLAEVLLSGLIERVTPPGTETDGEEIVYRIRPDVVENLRAMPLTEAADIVKELTKFIAEHTGGPVEFTALMPDPQGRYPLPDWAQPFARAGGALLGGLGPLVYPSPPGPAPVKRPKVALMGTSLDSLRAALERRGHVVSEMLTADCEAAILVDASLEDMGNMAAESDRTGVPHMLHRPQDADLEKLFAELDRTMEAWKRREGRIVNFPELPEFYYERPDFENRIREALESGAQLICISGEPGTGRLTLVNKVVRDPVIRRMFPSGVYFGPHRAYVQPGSLLVIRAKTQSLVDDNVQIVIGDEAEIREVVPDPEAARWVNVTVLSGEQLLDYLSLATGLTDLPSVLAKTPARWPNLDVACAWLQLIEPGKIANVLEGSRSQKLLTEEERSRDLAGVLRPAAKSDLLFLCAGRSHQIPEFAVEGLRLEYLPLFRKASFVSEMATGGIELDQGFHKHFHSVGESNPEIHRRFARVLLDHPHEDFSRQNIVYHLVRANDLSAAAAQVRNVSFLIRRFERDGMDALCEDLELAQDKDLLIHLKAMLDRTPKQFDIAAALVGFPDAAIARAAIRHRGPEKFVLVAGSADGPMHDIYRRASYAVGAALAKAEIGLLTCGYPGVDAETAEAYESNGGKRIVHVADRGSTEMFPGAMQIDFHPQTHFEVDLSDAAVLIGGREYVEAIGRTCVQRGKPVFPFGPSGLAASRTLKLLSSRETSAKDALMNPQLSPEEFARIVVTRIGAVEVEPLQALANRELDEYETYMESKRGNFPFLPAEAEVRAAMRSSDASLRRAGYAFLRYFATTDDVRSLAGDMMSDRAEYPVLHALILNDLLHEERFWPAVERIDPLLLRSAIEHAIVNLPHGAAPEFEETLGILRTLAAQNEGGGSGDLAAAMEALEIAQRRTESDPSNDQWLRDLSVSYRKLGGVLRKQGDLAGAETAYGKALALSQRQAEADPSNTVWQRDLTEINGILADLRGAQGGGVVAVWDSAGQFHELPEVLDRLNSVQSVFHFRPASLDLPLSAWESVKLWNYLDAEAAGKLLGGLMPETGADFLFVAVDTPMVSDAAGKPVYNIFGWWPRPKQPRVLIYSTAGFALWWETPEKRMRAFANVATGLLIAALMDSDSHSAPPRDCPNYYNPERDQELLTSPQRYCESCLDKMRNRLPTEAKAAQAILAAFAEDMPPRTSAR